MATTKSGRGNAAHVEVQERAPVEVEHPADTKAAAEPETLKTRPMPQHKPIDAPPTASEFAMMVMKYNEQERRLNAVEIQLGNLEIHMPRQTRPLSTAEVLAITGEDPTVQLRVGETFDRSGVTLHQNSLIRISEYPQLGSLVAAGLMVSVAVEAN